MKPLFLIFFVSLCIGMQAQKGFFLEGGVNVVSINQDAGINANVSANFLFKSIYVGAFYERLITNNTDIIPPINALPTPSDPFDTTRYFNQSSGVKLGAIILPDRLISVSPEIGLGWSNVFWESAKAEKDQYWNVVPALKVTIRAAKVLRVGLSANYRYYAELKFNNNTPSISSNKLGGLGGGLFLRLGKFQ